MRRSKRVTEEGSERLADLERAVSTLESVKGALESRMHAKKEECRGLEKELSSVRSQLQEAGASNAQLSKALEERRARIAALERERDALESQRRTLEAERDELENKLATNTKETSARVAALERERDQVKSRCDDIQTQRNELEKQRDELKSVLSYAEGLKIELSEELKAERLNAAALSKEYNDYKAAHTKSNEERSAEVEGIKKRASALAAQLAEGKRKHRNHKSADNLGKRSSEGRRCRRRTKQRSGVERKE